MNSILNFFRQIPGKTKTNVIVALIVILLVLFILPYISINKTHPFASMGARFAILAFLALALGIKLAINHLQTHKQQAIPLVIEKCKSSWQWLKNKFINIWSYSKTNAKELKYKIKQDHKRRRLRRLPWYLVLGAQGSGKRTTINNTGLYFARPEHFGDDAVNYISQFPDFEWWFSEQAVLIDVMTYEKENDTVQWKRFTKLLRRERKNKPINGIILTISIADLLLYSNQSRQEFIQSICYYIREIHNTFKSQVPVYLLFNKCDLIEGFMEFFNDLSKEELRQVWGMTLPLENCTDPGFAQNFFNNEYNQLIAQLRKRVMWALDIERSPRGRELINAFPQQMQLFKKPIESFIVELFGATRYHKALQLRGIYFASCTQENGEPHDFLLQAMSKKFQLVPPKFQRPHRLGECYFMRSLFFDVIFSEAHFLGDSERSKRMRKIIYNTTIGAAPVVIIITIVGMYNGYKENLVNLKQVKQHINNYNAALATIKNGDASLIALLPALDQLDKANNLYSKSSQIGLDFLFATKSISHSINDALLRSLNSLFLPRIAAQIENRLNQNIQDQNLLYATLKGYLAFDSQSDTMKDAISAPMEYQWDQSFLNEPETQNKLKYYLKTSLTESTPKLPLDNHLISRIRGELEEIIPSQRAYGLLSLRSSVSNIPDLLLSSAIGHNFHDVFTAKNPKLCIPALYTRSGYEKIFLKQYNTISKEVAEDNRDIGLVNDSDETQTATQISLTLEQMYNQRYIHSWNKALANIDIVKFKNLNQAINTLDLLISKQSPFPKLLNIIYDNSQPINHDKVQVTEKFEAVNEFGHATGAPSWHNTTILLTKIRNYLITLQQSANQDQAMYDAAKAAMQGTKSPIQELSLAAQKAPLPVKRWLDSIANNCWQIVVQGAHAELNAKWTNTVMNIYNSNLRGRYPLERHAKSQIAINDFDAFFSNGGTLETYFNKYLKPFVNTNTTPWTLYKVNNHSIDMPEANIHLFERAATLCNDYFPHGAKKASFNFTIMPLTLDSDASSIEINLGNQSIVYQHGPQNSTSVHWPMPFNAENASIMITGFGGEQYTRSASGPWALFKLFQYGDLYKESNSGTYRFDINFKKHHASYKITGTGDIDIFKLSELDNFKLPDVIAPDNG